LGRPSKFQRFSRLGFVTAATSLNGSQPNFAGCLAVFYIYISGGCKRNLAWTEFCQVQNSVCVLQVLCSPIGNVTALHSSSGCDTNFAALSTRRHLYSAWRPSRWALAYILVLLYKSMVRPHLEYVNSVWCTYKQGDIKELEKIQTRMWANAQRDGRPAYYRWLPLFNTAVWLTPTTSVPCSNAAKTRNPLKFAGLPQTRQQISAASRLKFTIL